jgi:CheY-like chemotaxis protein
MGARVLVVEDDMGTRSAMVDMLEEDGHTVVAMTHGAEALEFLRHESIDLVLLDILTPYVNGLELIRAYRALPIQHAPVIICSALRNAVELADEAGAEGVLPKPFYPKELLELVHRHAPVPLPAAMP